MTTKEVLHLYFNGIRNKTDWQNYIADDISFSSPRQTTIGKDEYITATSRFLQMVESSEIIQLVIEGNNACALVNYKVKSPAGNRGVCEVAEILSVKDNKLSASKILFDTAAFKDFIAQG